MAYAVGLSTLVAVAITVASPARAHEVQPTIADITREGDALLFDLRLNIESFVAGINLAEEDDTEGSLQAVRYARLHALPAAELAAEFEAFWPLMTPRIKVDVDGSAVPLTLVSVTPGETTAPDIARLSTIQFSAALPVEAEMVSVGWAREFGDLVVVQQGVDDPFDSYLSGGAMSAPFAMGSGQQPGFLSRFFSSLFQ